MAQSAIEKILARASGKGKVSPGEIVEAKLDAIITHDFGCRTLRGVWKEYGLKKIKNPESFVVVNEHWFSPPDKKTAEILRDNKDFLIKQGVRYFYEGGEGITHRLMLEKGHALPGNAIVGMDSHTTAYGAVGAFATGIGMVDGAVALATGRLWLMVPETYLVEIEGKPAPYITPRDVAQYIIWKIGEEECIYKGIEYRGSYIKDIDINGRIIISTMALELGAKAGFIEPDKKTIKYIKERTDKTFSVIKSDSDYRYPKEIKIDISSIEPQIGCPPTVSNSTPVSEIGDINIDQATIAGCVSGFIEDIRDAVRIIKGKKVKNGVRFYVVPGSRDAYLQALNEGLIGILVEAGANILPPGCGPCQAVNCGYLLGSQVQVSTVPRSYAGRAGTADSITYMASPLTVAASAITGKITDPRVFM